MQPINLNSLENFNPVPGYNAKLIHGDTMTVAHWKIEKDHELPVHSLPHEQIVNVMAGEFELVLDGTPHRLQAGQVLVIPGDVPHSGRAITDCELIDVWHPCRDDYR